MTIETSATAQTADRLRWIENYGNLLPTLEGSLSRTDVLLEQLEREIDGADISPEQRLTLKVAVGSEITEPEDKNAFESIAKLVRKRGGQKIAIGSDDKVFEGAVFRILDGENIKLRNNLLKAAGFEVNST